VVLPMKTQNVYDSFTNSVRESELPLRRLYSQ
jgi:hypothetical protein